jgi:hypothetical protein
MPPVDRHHPRVGGGSRRSSDCALSVGQLADIDRLAVKEEAGAVDRLANVATGVATKIQMNEVAGGSRRRAQPSRSAQRTVENWTMRNMAVLVPGTIDHDTAEMKLLAHDAEVQRLAG